MKSLKKERCRRKITYHFETFSKTPSIISGSKSYSKQNNEYKQAVNLSVTNFGETNNSVGFSLHKLWFQPLSYYVPTYLRRLGIDDVWVLSFTISTLRSAGLRFLVHQRFAIKFWTTFWDKYIINRIASIHKQGYQRKIKQFKTQTVINQTFKVSLSKV